MVSTGAGKASPSQGRAGGGVLHRGKQWWVTAAVVAPLSPCAQNTHWHMATGSPEGQQHDNNNTVAHRGRYRARCSAVCVV